MSYRAWFAIAAMISALLAVGCGSDNPDLEGSGGSGGGGAGGGDPVPVCGNGVVEGDEACDDGDANSDTEPDACRTDCTPARCGDGVTDSGEACDDGNGTDGDGCSADCQIESRCGDGVRDEGEECDGGDLGGRTCLDYGHNAGTVTCSSACTIDTSACRSVEFCDNGTDDDHDGLVDCDDPDCDDDLANCGPRCGDGVVNRPEEQCDGNDIPTTCEDRGSFLGGTMRCTDACTFDTSNCIPVEDCSTPDVDEDGDGLPGCDDPDCLGQEACIRCGDGIVSPGEQCDTVPPQGLLCANLGTFNAGKVRCNEFCEIDTSECTLVELCGLPGDEDGNGLSDCEDPACDQVAPCPVCGNGVRENDEECDDGNFFDRDGCSPRCKFAGVEIPPVGVQKQFAGSHDVSDPTLSRRPTTTCGTSTGTYHYDLIVVTNYTQSLAAVRVNIAWTGGTGYLIASTSFDPASPEDGCLGGTSGSTTGLIVYNIGAGETIFFLATSSTSGATLGNYTVTIEGIASCGDGIKHPDYEGCDDGNLEDGDGCDRSCQVERGWVCENGTDCRPTVCGDGIVEGYEECEGGPLCTEDCLLPGNSCLLPLVIGPEHYDPLIGSWRISGDTRQYHRTFSASCTSSQGKRDAVVAFTPPETGAYFINYLKSYDGVLMVWEGGCDSLTGTQRYCADGPENTSLELTEGSTIFVIADGWGSTVDESNAGPFTIEITPIRVRNTCSDPVDINAIGGGTNGVWTWSGTTSGAGDSYSGGTCRTASGHDLVGRFVAPTAGSYLIQLSASSYDPILYGWRSTCGPGSTQLLCKDDFGTGGTESATVTLAAGEEIFLVADGWSGGTGPFTMTITRQ